MATVVAGEGEDISRNLNPAPAPEEGEGMMKNM